MTTLLDEWRGRMSRRRAFLVRGYALYCGHRMYFPLKSHVFQRTIAEGVYEPEIVDMVLALLKPGTAYFDVGANIGLLSLPVLARRPDAQVVSVEASPDTMPYLERTHRDAGRANWTVVNAAVGDRSGEVEFWSGGAARGAFDGLKDTGRGGGKHAIKVTMRTLDDLWQEIGRPPVSVIKIDIEGGETLALRGAKALLEQTRPAVIIEWSATNLKAYGIAPESLFELCGQIGYTAYAIPGPVRVDGEAILRLTMLATETFLLLPSEQSRA